MKEEIVWAEKYRPQKVADCILPDSIKNVFLAFAAKGEVPNMTLSGRAGIGKTTVAIALCEEIGLDYLLVNCSDDRGISFIQTNIKNYATSMSLMGGRKVIIMDEADNLTPDSQKALRGVIEAVSSNCTFIFTCNFKNKIMEAIHSRCPIIEFKTNGSKAKLAAQFFERVEWILKKENVEYDQEVVAAVITKHFPDNRRILGELQRYSVTGAIDKGLLANISDINIDELVKALKTKNFSMARKWTVDNLDNDPAILIRKLYDGLYDKLEPKSVPQMVLILAKYQYQIAFVADLEINLVACLTEIMVDCEFK